MEMGSEAAVVGELIAALDRATLMAKQLPSTAEPSHLRQIYTTLTSTHHHLTMFLANHHPPAENSVSSAAVGIGGGDDCFDTDEPMHAVDYENEAEENSKNITTSIDGVEESMRECFIQNKRAKRPLSPSVDVEPRRSYENEAARGGYVPEFDPQGTKLRALDLIYQFHG